MLHRKPSKELITRDTDPAYNVAVQLLERCYFLDADKWGVNFPPGSAASVRAFDSSARPERLHEAFYEVARTTRRLVDQTTADELALHVVSKMLADSVGTTRLVAAGAKLAFTSGASLRDVARLVSASRAAVVARLTNRHATMVVLPAGNELLTVHRAWSDRKSQSENSNRLVSDLLRRSPKLQRQLTAHLEELVSKGENEQVERFAVAAAVVFDDATPGAVSPTIRIPVESQAGSSSDQVEARRTRMLNVYGIRVHAVAERPRSAREFSLSGSERSLALEYQELHMTIVAMVGATREILRNHPGSLAHMVKGLPNQQRDPSPSYIQQLSGRHPTDDFQNEALMDLMHAATVTDPRVQDSEIADEWLAKWASPVDLGVGLIENAGAALAFIEGRPTSRLFHLVGSNPPSPRAVITALWKPINDHFSGRGRATAIAPAVAKLAMACPDNPLRTDAVKDISCSVLRKNNAWAVPFVAWALTRGDEISAAAADSISTVLHRYDLGGRVISLSKEFPHEAASDKVSRVIATASAMVAERDASLTQIAECRQGGRPAEAVEGASRMLGLVDRIGEAWQGLEGSFPTLTESRLPRLDSLL